MRLENLLGPLRGFPKLDGARCVGRWALFDSTDPLDAEDAISICRRCEALPDCGAWFESLPANAKPSGVVARTDPPTEATYSAEQASGGSRVTAETYVTRHTTRGRLQRLRLKHGDALDAVLASCKDEKTKAMYLDALCVSWFGPIPPKSPRSDRGCWHALPERVWRLTCERCAGGFDASRWDAQFCSNACRQAMYRRRQVPDQ